MAVSKDDFQSCIAHCRNAKMHYAKAFGFLPHDFSIRYDGSEIYFLAPVSGIGNSLFSVEVQGEHNWKMMTRPERKNQLSRSEQLLRERMRASGSGITQFKYIASFDSNLVNTGNGCILCPCYPCEDSQMLNFPTLAGAIDYKLCPGDKNVLACVRDGDIWMMMSHNEEPLQITKTKAFRPQKKITAGQSSFILQEEFDRYTGYWWDPTSGKDDTGIYRILYEEVDETDVEIVHTFNPSKQEVEEYSYPRPGGKNAVSVLKMVEVTLNAGKPTIEEFVLAPQIAQYISKFEYITRVGWTDNGKSIWVQILTREQQLSELLLISQESFIRQGESKQIMSPIVLWKEKNDTWINIKHTCCFNFLPVSDDSCIKLIVVTEETGFPHITLLEGNVPNVSIIDSPTAVPLFANLTAKAITFGEWSVLESKVWVDNSEGIVYFQGNQSSCLDKHLYAVDLFGQIPCNDPIQLTPSGYYHNIEINLDQHLFVTSYSNQITPPAVAVYSFSIKPFQVNLLFHISSSIDLPPQFTAPTNFTATASTGEDLYGVVYPPYALVEGKKYPTVLYVYGGPEFQIVKNDFSRFLLKLSQWITAGFAVVMLDNRGSFNRGKKFESYIQNHMGDAEVEDQVAGIKAAAQVAPYIDLSRVAIAGWSYGGYMALLGIAKKPDVFKVAISGAPVTDLLWYDTGYTERYLGIPPSRSYQDSSVLSLASKFPNEPGRVLIIHGMNDENVLYTHTSLLIDALIAHGKPYQVQLFTGERHGIRNPLAASHCDATVLQFLLTNL